MSHPRLLLAGSLSTILLTSCGAPEAPPPAPEVARFEGIPIPGKLADAKAAGFTNCDADFQCQATRPLQIAGLTAQKAEIRLSYRDWSQGYGPDLPAEHHTPANLAYGSISYDFGPYKYAQGCTANPNLEPCLDWTEGMGVLVTALTKAGWLVESSRGGWRAYKAEVPAAIYGDSRFSKVEIYPATLEAVSQSIGAIHEERARYAKIDADRQAVQELMKP